MRFVLLNNARNIVLTRRLNALTNSLLTEQRLSQICDWLSPLTQDFNAKQHDTFHTNARQDGLGRWVLDTQEYRAWIANPGQTLWCIGDRT